MVAIFLAGICTVWLPRDGRHPGPDEYRDEYYSDVLPNLDEELLAVCVAGGILVGSFVGLLVGANQVRPVLGAFLGTFVGMTVGAAAGALLAVPEKTLPIAVGSLVLVLFGAVVRRYSGRPPD